MLQPWTPINFFEIKLKIHPNLFHLNIIFPLLPSHMLEGRSSIHIMQFFCFIDNSFNVWTSHQSDFTDDVQIEWLLLGEIVMGNMTSSFETIRKWYCFFECIILCWEFLLKNIKYLLIWIVFIGKSFLFVDDFYLLYLLFG